MHFQFLIEDQSGEEFVNRIMPKLTLGAVDVTYNCKAFKGIGGFSRNEHDPMRAKTNKLLNDLTLYLKGFSKSLAGFDSAVFILLDNDKRNVASFSQELQDLSVSNGITCDHVYCAAVEEMEAWLLGDIEAIRTAYPEVRLSITNGYVQDSICGTWEVLANAIHPGGLSCFRRDCPTFREIGKQKAEWASRIVPHMHPERNLSPSFRFFLMELTRRIA